MSEPWIGDETQAHPGICAYSPNEGQPVCGALATVHVLSESAIHGEVSLPTCDHHAPIARTAGAYIAEHSYGPGCATHETIWGSDGCDRVYDCHLCGNAFQSERDPDRLIVNGFPAVVCLACSRLEGDGDG